MMVLDQKISRQFGQRAFLLPGPLLSTVLQKPPRALLLMLALLPMSLGHSLWAAAADAQTLPVSRWLASSFTGPEDGQLWHSVFYINAIDRPQSITRHSGLMIRCTAAPVTNNLKLSFAFGAVLRTNTAGDIGVKVAMDGQPQKQLQLVTRNQANAEFYDTGAKSFLLQMLAANTLQFTARLSPKGTAKVAMPLAPGRTKVSTMLQSCGIDLAAEAAAEAKQSSSRSRPAFANRSDGERSNQSPVTPLARAVSAYMAASDATAIAAASTALEALNPSVNSLITAIQAPDALSAQSLATLPGRGQAGVSSRTVNGTEFPFHVLHPDTEPPAAGLPLAIVLHGGVQRPQWRERERWWQDYPFSDQLRDFLVVSPAGWRGAPWWGDLQQQNLTELIAQMQRHYHVDSSRIFVLGVSDGGAGALNLAMTHSTSLAGVVSLIGHPGVLYENHINTGPQPQFANLTQVPVFMANGGADQRLPQETLNPWLQSMRALGVGLTSYIEPDMGHELNFGANVRTELGQFLQQTKRDQTPRELAWEAGPKQLPARHRWLVIEALSSTAQQGCVQARRLANGNYQLRTEGIAQLRVLVDHDSERALRLTINAGTDNAQTERLEATPNVAALLRWHQRDSGAPQFFSSDYLLDIQSSSPGVCQSSVAHTIVAQADQQQRRQRQSERAERLRASLPTGIGSTDRDPISGNTAGSLGEAEGAGNSRRPIGDPTRIDDPRNRPR